ncbi:PepSY domain-containing protein [Oceanicaulis sp.]|uniref:PepSY domain-containing protein n=1 Tax=Oceanicaulis sp. TaxID=1924941 RepID=UPI003F720D80
MMILRNTVRLHKWLALLIGFQVLLWLLGGLVMSALPIERVRSEHNIASHPPLSAQIDRLVPVSQAAQAAGLTSLDEAVLTGIAGQPVWRLQSGETISVVSAVDARILSPITATLAEEIANHDFLPQSAIQSVRLLDAPPSEYGPGGPVWQIVFSDPDNTRLYVDPQTGVVRARRSDTWRLFDFFWKLHVMDYDDGADFNHPLLIGAAFLGVLVSLAGLIILFFRMRRSFAVWRKTRGT